MTDTRYRQPEGVAEFADELRLLAEAVLERVEPVLRNAAAEDRPEWGNCTWCPVCAAAALLRGEQHEVLATVAAHGTAIVTVLREALAGAPVDPIVPHDHGPETTPAQGNPSPDEPAAADTDRSTEYGATRPGDHRDRGDATTSGGSAASGKSRYVGIPVNIKP